MKTKILIVLIALIGLAGGISLGYLNDSRDGEVCIYSDDYAVKLVMPTSFGLLEQFALLPNGDIAMEDSSNGRILLFRNDAIETIASGDINTLTALPDGRIAYAKGNEILLLDYVMEQEERLGTIPGTRHPEALGSDKQGTIYVGTSGAGLFRFKDGKLDKLADSLPFSDLDSVQITDIAVGLDGTVYIAGFEKIFAVSPDGAFELIADGLANEPVWLEIASDGMLYINELSRGLQRFDPKVKQFTQINTRYGFYGMLSLNASELFVHDPRGFLLTLNLLTDGIEPLYVNAGNDFAFAAGDDKVFFATPSLDPVLKQHIVELNSAGNRNDLNELSYAAIFAADVDSENRLVLLTNEGIVRRNRDGSVTSLPIHIEGREWPQIRNIAAGHGIWYVTATDFNEKIEVFSVNETGEVKFLPISFTPESLGAYTVDDARLDVAPDGSLALFVTGRGSPAQGPYIQRVYRANADGTGLREITRLDSGRIAGMVDIAVDRDNNVFVLTMQGERPNVGGSDSIYKIDKDGKTTEAVHICPGRDPESIDVDPNGNIWFGSTLGVFKATPKAP